jgi:protein O-GlcNAc transferase
MRCRRNPVTSSKISHPKFPDVQTPPPEELACAAEAVILGDPAGEGSLRELCHRFPGDARVHFLLGALLDRLGRTTEALIAMEQSLGIDADNVQALSGTASLLIQLGRPGNAQGLLTGATRRRPDSAQLWFNLGVAMEAQNDWLQALAAYDCAVALPAAPDAAWMNRGYVLTRLGRLDEAFRNNEYLAGLRPDLTLAHFNVAEVLLALERFAEAKQACERAISLEPDFPDAYIDRALAAAALGEVAQAQSDLDRAASLDPQSLRQFRFGFAGEGSDILGRFGAHALRFHFLHEALERGDWSHRDELPETVKRLLNEEDSAKRVLADPDLPFRTLGFDLPLAQRHALATMVASGIEARVLSHELPPVSRHTRGIGRIRLGYLSPEFRMHPTSLLTRRLYCGHDRSKFEVFGYSLAPADGSWLAQEVREGFDRFREVGQMVSEDIARRIREDEIDILVDLSGYLHLSRGEVLALRPAPLQVNWLGYPGTLGARYVDYAIVDAVVCPPGADAHWSEKLIRLPDAYLIVDNDPRIDSVMPNRAACGLPEEGFVFCCFNNAWKIGPRIFSTWMQMLREVAGSVLWLIALRDQVAANLRREAQARGVDPARLVFAPRLPNEKHLLRYRLADLFLDTLDCNAHTTAIDALREGLPIITVPGESMQSRVAASLLRSAGGGELVCESLDQYRQLGIKLATRPDAAAAWRNHLRQSRSSAPLFNTDRFIRHLEDAYLRMWECWRAGMATQSLNIPARPAARISPRWY